MKAHDMSPHFAEAIEASFALGEIETSIRVLGGDWNEIFRIKAGGDEYAVRCMHPRFAVEGILYTHQVTTDLQRTLPEVAVLKTTIDHKPFVEVDGRLLCLMPWIEGEIPRTDEEWLLEATATMLAKLHDGALSCSVKQERPDRATYHDMNWSRNHIFDIDIVREVLLDDHSPLYRTSKPEEREYVDGIVARKGFILDQYERVKRWMESLNASGRPLVRAPIHGDIYNRNLLCDEERIVGIIDWDSCDYEPLTYELGRVLWEYSKVASSGTLDRDRARRFINQYYGSGGPAPRDEADLLVPYIRMIRITEVLLYVHNSVRGDLWFADYTMQNLMALEHLADIEALEVF